MKKLSMLLLISVLFYASENNAGNRLKFNMETGYQLEGYQVYTLDGKKSRLADLWKEKPVLLITGSLSCPPTRRSLINTTKLINQFKQKINIAVLYVIDAHPKGDVSPYSGKEWIPQENYTDNILIPQPKGQSQRNDRANELNKLLGLEIPIFVDNMENAYWKNLGRLPNAGILIDVNGKIIAKQKWFKANKMARRIENYLAGIEQTNL